MIPHINSKGPLSTIYGLADPADPLTPRYVGRTTQDPNRRLFAHCFEAYKSKDRPLSKWLLELWSQRIMPVVIVYERVPKEQAQSRETFWIQSFRKTGMLLNVSDGAGPGKGRRPSALNIQKTIERNKRGWSEATRAKQIAVKTGKRWSQERVERFLSNPRVRANYKALADRNRARRLNPLRY